MKPPPLAAERAPVPSGGSVDKAAKFGWIVRDKRGRFERIPKGALQVDNDEDGYQRDLTSERATTMARAWSWAAAGCLIVARRADGSLWVIDGQHRLHAAMVSSHIRDLDCLVWDIDDRTWEAEVFLLIQKHRAPVTAHHKFRNLRMQGDAIALAADALARKIGRIIRPGGDSQSIDCVDNWMRRIKMDQAAMTAIAPLLSRLCAGRRLDRHLLDGLFYLECQLRKHGQSLAEPFWAGRLDAVGADTLLKRGQMMRDAEGKVGEKTTARGFYKALTERVRRPTPDIFHERAD